MQRLRLVAITIVATLAVASAAAAPGGEVEIEIPRAAGPSTVAQVDSIAALDPGKADAGVAEAHDQAWAPAKRPQATPAAK